MFCVGVSMTDTAIDELVKKIEQLEKHNEELQSLDSLQQMTIERFLSYFNCEKLCLFSGFKWSGNSFIYIDLYKSLD